MIFNSVTFLVFFILFYFTYWIISQKGSIKLRNILTTVASYIFYGWWDWRFLSLIILSSATDFILGKAIHNCNKIKAKKQILIASLVVNLGILGFFKYFNFFIDSFVFMLDQIGLNASTSTLQIILPVGISFYTFQTLSYTIDIYKGKMSPTKDILSFFAFVSFFPQLVAGPIERASNLLHQFHEKKKFDYRMNVEGLRLVLWGFFKKIVIADNFGVLADNLFAQSGSVSGLAIIFATFCFALQIYADFSGYSDIAIGISRMLGFNLMTNFRTPYFSVTIREFWSRWHISLSTWFRDYVYIPLGGSKVSIYRNYFNIMVTFVLSGIWHGANITYVLWGALHGLMLVIEKHLGLHKLKGLYYPIVLLAIVLFYIPFRAANYTELKVLTASLFNFSEYSWVEIVSTIDFFSIQRFATLMAVAVYFIGMELFIKKLDFNLWIKKQSKITRHIIYYSLVMLILLIGNFSVKPDFIYFQF